MHELYARQRVMYRFNLAMKVEVLECYEGTQRRSQEYFFWGVSVIR